MADCTGPATSCGFETVLEDFKKNAQLTPKQSEDFKFDSLDGLRSTIHTIQNEQAAKKRMRHMKRLEPFLRTMEQYGKVVEIFVNTSEVLAFVWGPMKWLLIVASNYVEALDSLLDAYQAIWEELPSLNSFQQLLQDRPYLQNVLRWIYQDIMDFHKEAMAYFRQKTWRQVFQAAWRGFKLKIDLIKQRMQRHGNLIKMEATLAEFEEIRRLNQTTAIEFNNMRQAELDRKRNATIQWLSASNSQVVQEEYIEASSLCVGAGDWLVADHRFRNWSDLQYCSNPLLWMTGKPGAGKSVLVSRVVTEIQQFCKAQTILANQGISVAYFYCKHSDPDRNTFIAVARGILSQLLKQQPHLLDHLYEQSSMSGDISLSSKSLAQDLLNIALNGGKVTYIVIDGFDECDKKSRKEIISFFRAVVEALPPAEMDSIRCLFVGQDDGISPKDFTEIPKIPITPTDNRGDIHRFAEAWHSKIQSKLGLEDSKFNLVKFVTARSQGMFLFAKLAMENLFEQTSQEKFASELERFPEGLDEAYGRIVSRILDTQTAARRDDSLKLLEWLVCAKRPMKWYEIQGALCIDLQNDSGREIDFQARRFRETPKDLCASLVEFRKDRTVEFVHPTAKEYLIKKNLVNISLSENMISSLTLGYLTLPVMDQSGDELTIREAIMNGSFAYLEYAVACWSLHFRTALATHRGEDQLAMLCEDVDIFIESRYKNPETNKNALKDVVGKLSALKSSGCFERLCHAVSWAHRQLSIHGQAPSDDDVLDLSNILLDVRSVFEALAASQVTDEQRTVLENMYGHNWFKCPRINCLYFHRGFKSKSQRQHHVDRHDRPYMCILPECDASTFGFVTEALLNQHMDEEHGGRTESELEFPQPKKQKLGPLKAESKHACTICSKKFTRSHNLKAHMRKHANEKPFLCEVCKKGFARKHDLKRHESTHAEKKHVCSGVLKSGKSWGCNATFSRQDKLAEHFKTKTGQQCVMPVLAEEREEVKEGDQRNDFMDKLAGGLGIEPGQLVEKPLFLQHSSYVHTPTLATL
ncbi:putative C2H2-type domain-containing protein [Seiridium cardinale]|uniref:C2H2-type domain-containing protein n=1 Tax=Seiridium cardinale TaxID=138064 RepID=A0ABR2XKH9_9PEZI